jgi:dihydroneopterin aldolase
MVTVEVWLEKAIAPEADDPANAWDYDHVRHQVVELAGARRYNLQETLAEAIYERIAAMHGVRALRITTAKPDIYPDARGVGVEIASFKGVSPED